MGHKHSRKKYIMLFTFFVLSSKILEGKIHLFQIFIASEACLNSVDTIWKSGILSQWFKVLFDLHLLYPYKTNVFGVYWNQTVCQSVCPSVHPSVCLSILPFVYKILVTFCCKHLFQFQ